jgi:hypothetical protein
MSDTSPAANFAVCAQCSLRAPPNTLFKNCPCKLAAYCSTECQKAHHKEHKRVCTVKVPRKHKMVSAEEEKWINDSICDIGSATDLNGVLAAATRSGALVFAPKPFR